MPPLDRSFYASQTTVQLSKALLGKVLVRNTEEGRTSGIIVETEAYLRDDPACHASRGMTKRNESMFKEAGHAYVYLIYGRSCCFNIVSEREGVGEAVLIRALEPIEGLDLMRQRRKTDDLRLLASGPGRLCEAMAIDRRLDGATMWDPRIFVQEPQTHRKLDVLCTSRIGISSGTDLKLRFLLEENPFVSRKAVSRIS